MTGVVCKADQHITVQLQWDMPNPDGNVEYDLWTNSDDSTRHVLRLSPPPYIPSPRIYLRAIFGEE